MKYLLLLLTAVAINTFAAAQTYYHQKHVLANGGSISKTSNYSSFCVVGQLAASEFSTNAYNGTIGYLNREDNTTSISVVESNKLKIAVYPNPSSGDVNIDINTVIKDRVLITITDVSGRSIYKNEVDINSFRKITINKNAFVSSGTYTIQFSSSQGISSQKIVIIE